MRDHNTLYNSHKQAKDLNKPICTETGLINPLRLNISKATLQNIKREGNSQPINER